jgi:dihydroflavonol-4-reductase
MSLFSLAGARVLLTGGHGFIGSVVTRLLAERGCSVRCLVRPTSKVDRLDGFAFEAAPGDIRDVESLRRAAEGCDAAVHMAGLSSWKLIDSPAMEEVTEGGTRNLLAAAHGAGLEKVVFVSSATAVNAADDPRVFDESSPFELGATRLSYAIHKNAAESICRDFVATGLPVVIVNPAEVYGPGDTDLITAGNLVDFAKSSPVLVCSGGTSVVSVDDVALGVVKALERGRSGERYILAGDNLTIKDLASLTLELLRQKKKIVTLPNGLLRGLAAGARALRMPMPFNPHVIPYATRYWYMDSSKASRELGLSFRHAREVLTPTLAWLQETRRIPGSR